MNNLSNPKFARAVALFRLQFRARQKLYDANRRALELHGVAGNMVSGGHYEHWPVEAKQLSRLLNRLCNRLTDAAYRARPRYVRLQTMRELSHDVTMSEIARADRIERETRA